MALVSILLSVVALVAAARLTTRLRGRREKVSVPSAPASPVEEKAVELRPEWLPENTTLVVSNLNLDNHAEENTNAVAKVAKVKKGPKTVKGKKIRKTESCSNQRISSS